MPHCLVAAANAGAIAAALPRLFAERGLTLPSLEIAESAGAVASAIAKADIVLGQPAFVAPELASARAMTWLQSTFAGVEPLVQAGMRDDYALTGVKGLFGPLMREFVFGSILQWSRHFSDYQRQQSARIWQPNPYRSLVGQTLAVFGLGSIGQALVQTAKHFGMQVVGVNRSGQSVAGVDHCYSMVALRSSQQPLLAQADVVVLTLPATEELKHFVDDAFLSRLKQGALLINVGRGILIQEQALISALASGQLSTAVLDVFEQEPLPASHPFWGIPNLHITPHISALTFATDIAQLFTDNYARFVAGQPLLYRVDFARGY